jgi:sarcosine oxidase subunit alpha
VLCDENPEIGGSLTYARCDPNILTDLKTKLEGLPNLRLFLSTVCNGWYEDNWLPLIRGNTLFHARATHVIFATGTIDQPLVFRNNDLPGIVLGSAAQRLMRHYAV